MTLDTAVIGGVDMIQRAFDSDYGLRAAVVRFGFSAVDRAVPLQFFADKAAGRN